MSVTAISFAILLVLSPVFSQQKRNNRQSTRPSNASALQSSGRRGSFGGNSCALDYSVDYLLLALQWPTSFCYSNQRCNRNVDHKRWQIHGLWPQNRVFGETPEFCCSDRFDSRVLEPIRRELLDKWKTLREDGRHDQFWRHEWNKHGSCAQRSLSRELSSQLQYFETTLKLYDSLPLNEWLEKANVKPSNDHLYSLNDFHQSIEPHVKSRIRLECSLNPDPRPDAPPILSEIHICLDRKQLKVIDCPHRDDRQCLTHSPRSNAPNLILFPKH